MGLPLLPGMQNKDCFDNQLKLPAKFHACSALAWYNSLRDLIYFKMVISQPAWKKLRPQGPSTLSDTALHPRPPAWGEALTGASFPSPLWVGGVFLYWGQKYLTLD